LFLFLGASATLGVSANLAWSDNFNSYANDQYLEDGSPGDGGWQGWGNPIDPTAGAYVRDDQYHSAPYSVEIAVTSDLVHLYTGYTAGVWEYKLWQFIPTDFTLDTYFILLSDYDGSGTAPGCVWTVQLGFHGATGLIESQLVGPTMPFVRNEWKEIKCVIDLDTDWLQIYYDGILLTEHRYTDTVQGTGTGGTLKLVAVDLFGDTGSIVYYDDITLMPPEPLSCSAGGPYSGEVSEDINFTGDAFGGTPPYTYAWTFGDTGTATIQNPTHAYTAAGVYNVTLTVTDSLLATASDETTATITESTAPVIEIGTITGGLFKVKAVIKNTGDAAATDVDWKIQLTGGLIILGKESTGTAATIAAGGQVDISSKLILGFGKTVITVTADTATKSQNATVLLVFIKI
jgi:hypothetical protein